MKCATSSLHTQLALHEGIFGTEPKEPNYFSDDEQYHRGVDWYASLFSDAAQNDLAGESSTHYTKLPDYPDTIARMKALLPDVKLVYVMRNPIDRLVSHYIHQWTKNVMRGDIEEAVRRHPELVEYGLYAYQLRPYFDAYGCESVLPVFAAALARDPQGQLERVARHIGYPRPVRWDDELGRQNVSAERIRRFYGYRLLVDSPPMAFLRRRFVPQALRDVVKKRLTMRKRPVLSHATRERLKRTFDADLHTLSGWLGTDLTCDNFDETTAAGDLEWVTTVTGRGAAPS